MLTVTEMVFGVDGLPLTHGTLYIGTANAVDPSSSQAAAFWDYAGSIAATQPITIRNGRPWRNNAPAFLYTAADYSMQALDRTGSAIYYRARSPNAMAGDASQPLDDTLTAIAAMSTDTTPAVPAVTTNTGATTATRLVVGADLQAYTARLDALKALLDTLATAGPVDPETTLPTPLSCLLRYGTAGLVEADTTPYLKPADLTGLVTDSTLDSAIATLEADIAATYLTTALGDDRYIARTDESAIFSQIYGTDFTADNGTQPFFSAALNGGTIVGSGSVDARPGHHGIIKFVSNATPTADSGYRVWTGRYAIWMSGGQWLQVRFLLPSVTDVSTRIGFFDQNLFATPIVNGIYFDIVNTTATAYSKAASTASSSAYGTALAIDTCYRADAQFVAGGDLAVLKLYNDDTGALLFQAGFDTNLPLNAKCGAGVISVATTAVSSKDVILLDSMHYKAR